LRRILPQAFLLAFCAVLGISRAVASERPPAAPGPAAASKYLDLGMPLAARGELLLLTAEARAASPLLPRVIRDLAAAGRGAEALSLYEEARPRLAEPIRSEAAFEAGKIHWERKDYAKSAEAFRSVSARSGAAPLAALYLARLWGAQENLPYALSALSAAPPGGKKSLIEGTIAMTRKDRAAAALSWSGAPPGSPAAFSAGLLALSQGEPATASRAIRAVADNAAPGTPERTASLETLALVQLAGKEYTAALSAAREGIDDAGRLRAAAAGLAGWDGSRAGASRAWTSAAGLFPYEEDAGRFAAAGRKFLAAAALYDTLRSAGERAGALDRNLYAAQEGIYLRQKALASTLNRMEEIRQEFLVRRRRAGEMRSRLRLAAKAVSVPAWGAATDPGRTAVLSRVERRLKELQARIDEEKAAADAALEKGRPDRLPPDDRRMLFYSRQRLNRIEDSVRALEGRITVLKGRLWNRWKTDYVARLSPLLDRAEGAMAAAGDAAARADKASLPSRAVYAELFRWAEATARYRRMLAADAAALAERAPKVRAAADRAYALTRRELLDALGRKERRMRYIAARAATEWRIENRGSPGDNAVLPQARREEIRSEAIRHWEASLPPRGESAEAADEALYALAELRFEEAQERFLREGSPQAAVPDLRLPASLFHRVAVEHPQSPYAEPAVYGLALAWQEMGSPDNAALTLKTLLARYPRSRFADEAHVRLGEHHFDSKDFGQAEEEYRKVSESAPPDLRVTALFKLGWSLFLQGRPKEAAEPFTAALLASPAAVKTGGVPGETLVMVARSLVEANQDATAEAFLSRRGASRHGPAVLLAIQKLLDAQNRYADEAAIADRMGAAYPEAPERIDAETAAAEALRKGGKEEESFARRGRFYLAFGPRSAWRASPARTAGEIARADAIAEEGLRAAAFRFHELSRKSPAPDRRGVLALYDASLSLFPSSPKAEEVAYQRAWLLFEDGRKRDAKTAFEEVARIPKGGRTEAALYMSVQCAKDVSDPADAKSQEEVARLGGEYERLFPAGERIPPILMDRARALFNLRRYADAAAAADRAASLQANPQNKRAALRLSGEARFEAGDDAGAEKALRAFLALEPPPKDAREAEKLIGYGLFRRAEKMPQDRSAEAASLFLRAGTEFPALDIGPVALFRAGAAFAAAGKTPEATAALLPVEADRRDPSLSLDATRLLARLYEKSGPPLSAAERYQVLALAGASATEEKIKNLHKAAELFSKGKDEVRSRKALILAASLPDAPAEGRIRSYYRAGESARLEGKTEEAVKYYDEAVKAHRKDPGASPGTAGMAFFRLAEIRYAVYRSRAIAPPLEKTFLAKQTLLEESAALYLEAIRTGDADTVSASLHRLGEGLEDFRAAVLGSPPPPNLSAREREEYVFLLEEKAAPIEEKAVEAYLSNLRQSVAAGTTSEWVMKSRNRLVALRPARFGKKWEYAFPVLTVPDFHGVIERKPR
jgi:TolA-binding protein